MDIKSLLSERILVFDGAMGTLLQNQGLPPGSCPDAFVLEKPEAVLEVHRQYIEAGAEIIETNTFGASPIRLSHYGLEGKVREINIAAVRLARRASTGRVLIAGSIGPSGRVLQPLGSLPFEEAYQSFAVQAAAFAECKPDFIIVETMGDLNEMRAALMACRDRAPDIPVIAQITVDRTGRTYTGTPPSAAVSLMRSLGAAVVGVNCSVGPDLLVDVVRQMASLTELPISVQPNAGIPRLTKEGTVFPMGPEEFASYGPKLVEAGASVVGGCCGTTPDHIRLLKAAVLDLRPQHTPGILASCTTLSSRTKTVYLNELNLPVIVGERLNPTGRRTLAQDIREGTYSVVRKQAVLQANAGAHVLDVNVGVPLINEAKAMSQIVAVVQETTDLPVALDTTSPEVVEAGLRAFVGKALVNSFTLEKNRHEAVLALAKRYGAAVLGLTIDENGIPETAAGRLKVATQLVRKAEEAGIERRDIFIDPLALTAGAQQSQAKETIKAIRLIREELGCHVSLGISNVSFGLPHRPFLNSVYLSMALSQGLSMAIVNPLDDRIMDTVRAVRLFFNRDLGAKDFVENVGPKRLAHTEEEVLAKLESRKTKGAGASTDSSAKPIGGCKDAGPLSLVYQAVTEGNSQDIVFLCEEALRSGASPQAILSDALIPAIQEVGRLFGEGTYFLPQLMASAESMKRAFGHLKPLMLKDKGSVPERGTVVMATVKGDIHDIGKNIVGVLLENHGFRVVDLGKDVPAQEVLETVKRERAGAVFLSALMTTTMPEMKTVIDLLKKEGVDCPVVIGGASTTPEFAAEIGASGYGRDAYEAVREALRLVR